MMLVCPWPASSLLWVLHGQHHQPTCPPQACNSARRIVISAFGAARAAACARARGQHRVPWGCRWRVVWWSPWRPLWRRGVASRVERSGPPNPTPVDWAHGRCDAAAVSLAGSGIAHHRRSTGLPDFSLEGWGLFFAGSSTALAPAYWPAKSPVRDFLRDDGAMGFCRLRCRGIRAIAHQARPWMGNQHATAGRRPLRDRDAPA